MDGITSRPYIDQKDQDQVEALVLAFRVATRVDIYPTIWRFRLLLASRVWEPAQDTRVWEDGAGHIVAFGMLWRRRRDDTYLALDQFIHPLYKNDALVDSILVWAIRRTQRVASEQATPIALTVNALGPAIDHHLDRHGFVPRPPNSEEYNVYLARSLQIPFPSAVAPEGYTIRPLRDIDELEAYQALFSFTSVNDRHQQALLASAEYRHLVAVDQAGTLVSYCEFSICRAEWERSGRRIGWIDYIGTRPEQQQRGFGRAVLLASLHQMRKWGADTAMLITVNTNTPAIRLYSATGFTTVDIQEPLWYTKQIMV